MAIACGGERAPCPRRVLGLVVRTVQNDRPHRRQALKGVRREAEMLQAEHRREP